MSESFKEDPALASAIIEYAAMTINRGERNARNYFSFCRGFLKILYVCWTNAIHFCPFFTHIVKKNNYTLSWI